ncbi:hypothetical protein BJY52DRAFT_1212557 [Lactarius psammicola]|nr:hypothetical protein BJY52DRAFT_1212557 [Lactarius psammicola]
MSTIAPETSPSGPVVSLENFLFDYPEADIILRSEDSYEFRVLKTYIFYSSPILGDRVTAAPHPQSGATPLPIVQLSDEGAVLFSLLTYIFPVQPILPSTVEHTIKLLSATQRYKMDATLTHIRNHIAQQDPKFIREGNSLLVFSLAQKHGLRQEALQAARSTLRLPTFTIESLEERLEMMPSASLFALWQYRQRIRRNFASLLKDFIASSDYKAPKGSGRRSGCTHLATSGIPVWLDRYISSVGRNPSFLSLSMFHKASRDHVRSSSKVNCRRCFHCATMDVPSLWATLSTIYDDSITEAESVLLLLVEGASSETQSPGESASHHRHSNMPNADVLLRSSDFVDFRVNRSALVASSPFFGDMFSLLQSSDNEVIDGLPLVHFSEDASVLNSLISMLYPVSPEIPDSDDQVLTLLSTCQKYDMATVQSSIRAEVGRRGLLSPAGVESFRVFAVACRKGLVPEMEAAALLTLNYPLTFEYLGDVLTSFEPWALRKLARFHQYCRSSLISRLRLLWMNRNGPSNVWVGSCGPKTDSGLPDWLEKIFCTKFPKLASFEYPLPFVKRSSFRREYLVALQAHVRENDCSSCMKIHTLKGEEFCIKIEKKLAQAWDIQYLSRDELPGVREYTTFRAVSASSK